jgi:hypothetical protein
MILTFQGKVITSFIEYEQHLHSELVEATIIRNGIQRQLQLRTIPAKHFEVKHIFCFCGMVLHIPMLSVRLQNTIPSEVYISHMERGSPADGCKYLRPSLFIVELNGHSTPDLATFLEAAKTTTSDSCN